MRIESFPSAIPSRPGLGQRLRENLRAAWDAAPEDVAILSDGSVAGHAVNEALRFNQRVGFRTIQVTLAVLRSLVPGPPAQVALPAVAVPQVKPGIATPTPPPVVAAPPPAPPPVILSTVETARPRDAWASLIAPAAPEKLDRIEHFLDDAAGMLKETSRAEREQAMEVLLRAVPADRQDALWGDRPDGLGEVIREMRFHASTRRPNPEDPYGMKGLPMLQVPPPIVPIVEQLADCLKLAQSCPRLTQRPFTHADVNSAGWVAHTVYAEKLPETKAAWRDVYAVVGSFEAAQDWLRTLGELRPESRPEAVAFLRRAPVGEQGWRWRTETAIRVADKLQVLDASVLSTVQTWLPRIESEVEWKAVAECKRPTERLDESAARYARFDEAVRAHGEFGGVGVLAYRAWWEARGQSSTVEEAVDLARGLAHELKNRVNVAGLGERAKQLMRAQRPDETLMAAGARIAGVPSDALDALHGAIGSSTWEERRQAYERLLAASTGWARIGIERYQAVSESLAPGESMQDATAGFLALQKTLEPLETREENLLAVYRDLKAKGTDPGAVTISSLDASALPDALRHGLAAVDEPLAGLDRAARMELFVKVLAAVFHLSWNADTAWPEAAASYRAVQECVAAGESVDAAMARLQKICERLKPDAVRTQERETCTPSEAMRLVRLPAASEAFMDHLSAVRMLFNSANALTYRPVREARDDYAALQRDRFDGESLVDAAKRFHQLAWYTNPTSGSFDPRAAFAAVRKIEGKSPEDCQQVLVSWMNERRHDYKEALAELVTAQDLRLPGEGLAAALDRMRALAKQVSRPRPFYERVTRGVGTYEERLEALRGLTQAHLAARRSEGQALQDFDTLLPFVSPSLTWMQARDRLALLAPGFEKPEDARTAFGALMGPAPAGVPYEERERTLLSMLKAPDGSLEAYNDYCVVAELRLADEGMDAARERLDGLRQALPAAPEEVREAYRFVTRAAAEGQFRSRDEAQCRLIEGYLLRGNVKDAAAHVLASLPQGAAGTVSREENRVKIGSVWVSVRE